METNDDRAPARLRALPTWLLNQAALPGNRLVADALAASAPGTRRHVYSLLAALDERGPASQADLGRCIMLDRSDMVAAVNELVEQELAERTPDRNDLRRNVVSITAAGRRHLKKLDRAVAAAQDELLQPLSPAERTQLVYLLTKITDHHRTAAHARTS